MSNRTFKYLNPSVIFNPKYDGAGIEEEDEEGFSKSIKENGVYDPISVSVSSKDPNKFQIITGARRLYYAKKHKLSEIPCIIWKNASNTDIALEELVQIAHRRQHTHSQIARAIAAVYETIGVSLTQALQWTQKQRHSNQTGKNGSVGTPTPEFMKLFEKIGYSGSRQYEYLQLIAHIEPEVLEHAENRRLPIEHKRLLTHSQLTKTLDETGDTEEQKISFKKHLVNKIAGKTRSEAKNIVHDTISQIKEETDATRLGKSLLSERMEKDTKFQSMVKEGRQSSVLAFMEFNDGIDKAVKALTAGRLKLESGEANWDEISPERLKKVINTHSIEIIKNFKDLELISVLVKTRMLYNFAKEIIPYLENEQEDRSKKKELLER